MIGNWTKLREYNVAAARLITVVQLNLDIVGGCFVDYESVRRLACQVFLNDCILIGGHAEYTTLGADNLPLILPCSEQDFQDNKSVLTKTLLDMDLATLRPLGSFPICASYIKLFTIRQNLLRYIYTLSSLGLNLS